MLNVFSSNAQVWFVDGTVKCFTGGHIPLALWAIFCLLLCVMTIFTPLVYYASWKKVWGLESVIVKRYMI